MAASNIHFCQSCMVHSACIMKHKVMLCNTLLLIRWSSIVLTKVYCITTHSSVIHDVIGGVKYFNDYLFYSSDLI
jgi:hypothetical protein